MNDEAFLGIPGAAPLWLSVQLAAATTLILLLVGTPLAWWLAQTRSSAKVFCEAAVALPIVLPPTVMGFYLLVLLGPYGAVGKWWLEVSGEALTFSFAGLVIASCLYSLPFAVQPLQNAFEALGRRDLEAAWTLGARPVDAFFTVAVPQSARGFLNAMVLSFAHTLGEFGVVLMVGGNIPGETRTISIAIYDHVETLDYASAHRLSGILLGFAFLTLLAMYLVNHRRRSA